jgi:hypothetical protein
MWNKRRTVGAALALTLSACAFDDDAKFVPRHRAAYFLTASGQETNLVRLDETGTATSEPATDFDLHVTEKNTTLWALHENKIRWRGLDSGKSGELDFTPFAPKGICTGTERHVVWGEKRLCFIQNRTKNPHTVVIEVDFPPRMALYNNQKFYFVADTFIAVWHETAFSEILRVPTAFRPEHADFDELFNLLTIGPADDGQHYATKISATANVPLFRDAPSAMRTLWHSRIWKTGYGGEAVLKTAGMRTDGAAVPDVGHAANDVFFDFRHSRGYYPSKDSLRIYEFSPDFFSRKLLFATAWQAPILKARFDAVSGK